MKFSLKKLCGNKEVDVIDQMYELLVKILNVHTFSGKLFHV